MKKITNKKIIFFTNNISFINSHRLELLINLNKNKNKITVVANIDERLKITFAKIIKVNSSFFSNIKNYIKILKDEDYDIIHSIGIKTNLILLISTFFSQKKIIFHFTGLGNLFSKKKFFILRYLVIFIFNFLYKKNFVFIFQKVEDLDQINIFKKFNKKNIFIVPGSGVDNKKYKIKNNFDNKTIKILMASRLISGKGIDIYLDIAEKFNHDKKYLFYFAGKKNISGISINFKKFLNKVNSLDNFIYLGEEKKMHSLLRKIDIVVYPSNYGEGIPRFLLEALASGIPIISSNNSSSKYVVDDSINGAIIHNNSINDYSKKIKLFTKVSVRKKVSRYSKEKSIRLFDINKIITLHNEIYGKCL